MMRGVFALLLACASAQTYTVCNPTKEVCPPVEAIGTTVNIDFTTGEESPLLNRGDSKGMFSYEAGRGVQLGVVDRADNPLLRTDACIMYGKVDIIMRAAPGAGIVSCVFLQSNTLDEIDFEMVGNDHGNVQTNFFSKGQPANWDRGMYHAVADPQAQFHNYSIEWTPEFTKWLVDGNVVRTLTPAASANYGYPESPMHLRFGTWAAGDLERNPVGTVVWAGGEIDWNNVPYTMEIKQVQITDYSTGSSYEFTDMSGSRSSLVSNGGEIYHSNNFVGAPSILSRLLDKVSPKKIQHAVHPANTTTGTDIHAVIANKALD